MTKATTRKVKVGSTLHLLVGTKEDNFEKSIGEIVDNLKVDGDAAEIDNGTRIFIIDEEIADTSKEGSEAYTWDKSGNRVKHRRIRVTTKDGKRSEEFVRFVYKALVGINDATHKQTQSLDRKFGIL